MTAPASIATGVIKAYSSSTHKADVLLDDSFGTYLAGVKVLSTIHAFECRTARKCVLLFLDPNDPNEAWLIGIHDAVPPDLQGVAGWPGVQTVAGTSLFINGTGATATAANDAYYVPFVLPKRQTFSTMRIPEVITSSGNIDLGIYHASGNDATTRLASTGSVACPAAGTDRDVALTASVTLDPGKYMLAVAFNNTTASIRRAGNVAIGGVHRATSNFPLPSSAGGVAGYPSDKWFGLACY